MLCFQIKNKVVLPKNTAIKARKSAMKAEEKIEILKSLIWLWFHVEKHMYFLFH